MTRFHSATLGIAPTLADLCVEFPESHRSSHRRRCREYAVGHVAMLQGRSGESVGPVRSQRELNGERILKPELYHGWPSTRLGEMLPLPLWSSGLLARTPECSGFGPFPALPQKPRRCGILKRKAPARERERERALGCKIFEQFGDTAKRRAGRRVRVVSFYPGVSRLSFIVGGIILRPSHTPLPRPGVRRSYTIPAFTAKVWPVPPTRGSPLPAVRDCTRNAHPPADGCCSRNSLHTTIHLGSYLFRINSTGPTDPPSSKLSHLRAPRAISVRQRQHHRDHGSLYLRYHCSAHTRFPLALRHSAQRSQYMRVNIYAYTPPRESCFPVRVRSSGSAADANPPLALRQPSAASAAAMPKNYTESSWAKRLYTQNVAKRVAHPQPTRLYTRRARFKRDPLRNPDAKVLSRPVLLRLLVATLGLDSPRSEHRVETHTIVDKRGSRGVESDADWPK